MKVVTYLGMLTSTVALLFLCYFDPHPSSVELWVDVTSLSVLFSVHRVQRKTGTSLRLSPGLTIYRVNGKIRLRYKADYKRIAALEKELRLGDWDKPSTLAEKFLPGGQRPQVSPYDVLDDLAKAYEAKRHAISAQVHEEVFSRGDSDCNVCEGQGFEGNTGCPECNGPCRGYLEMVETQTVTKRLRDQRIETSSVS